LITLRPGAYSLRKLLRRPIDDVTSCATDRWTIAPASSVEVRPAKLLPGQLERIRGAEFGTIAQVVRDFRGGFDASQSATVGYRLADALLIDGVLYAGNAVRHLKARSNRLLAHHSPQEIGHATLYESWLGNRWFGNWLSDDCLTYRLAEAEGRPVTSEGTSGHKLEYERGLDMRPSRAASARFAELIVFDDTSHGDNKRDRANDLRRRLYADRAPRHPGVFLLRGQTGARRELTNEHQIAEHLAVRRGFQILDPSSASVEEIVRLCGGAEVVAGVEGSQLVHGLMLMPPDARAMVVQPPTRAVSALKLLTDRQGQDYSLVVGAGTHEAFSADADEIEKTLDLA